MPTHQFEATVGADGTLTLPPMPQHSGEAVEVTVRSKPVRKLAKPPADLTADLSNYDPFEPVTPPEDWEALR